MKLEETISNSTFGQLIMKTVFLTKTRYYFDSPKNIHNPNRAQVIGDNSIIKHEFKKIVNTGRTGTKGALNGIMYLFCGCNTITVTATTNAPNRVKNAVIAQKYPRINLSPP